MNKFLTLVLIVSAIALNVQAGHFPFPPDQHQPPHHGPGPFPGPGPGPHPGPQPGPPPGPGWNDIYGPPRTVAWQDLGSFQMEKFIDMNLEINVRDQFVNEVYVMAQNNQIEIRQAVAYLSNGQAFELRNLEGIIQDGRDYRVQLDYRNSFRLQRLVLTVRSPNLLGSRASLLMQLGLAY